MIEYNLMGFRHFTLTGMGAICGTVLSESLRQEIGNKIRYNPEVGIQVYWKYTGSFSKDSKWVNTNRYNYCQKCVNKAIKDEKTQSRSR